MSDKDARHSRAVPLGTSTSIARFGTCTGRIIARKPSRETPTSEYGGAKWRRFGKSEVLIGVSLLVAPAVGVTVRVCYNIGEGISAGSTQL